MAEWSFMTNHGRALLCIAHDPGMRLRDIADTLLDETPTGTGTTDPLAT